uniref:LTI65/LTI78 PGEED repeat domain-containing protein n=1 Tax=Noccaea caerulescens TaxID=107243 RepID=A0A1J3HA70_NOCCA
MKEYIIQKFEPGEDDRALSRVISEAISPRKASSEAATFSGATTTVVPAPNSADNKAPLLANTSEIVEEENLGKLLQPN